MRKQESIFDDTPAMLALARRALTSYNLQSYHLRLHQVWHNATFFVYTDDTFSSEIEPSTPPAFVLRLHRPEFQTAPGIKDELGLLQFLHSAFAYPVPEPLENESTTLLTPIIGETGAINAVLFRWIEGQCITRFTSHEAFQEVGRAIGRLHLLLERASDQTLANRRPWNRDGLAGQALLATNKDLWRSASHLIAAGDKLIAQAIDRLENHGASWHPIHADLTCSNIILTPSGVGLLDFDDCGPGLLAYDLAVSLLSMHQNAVPEEGLAQFIQGYAEVRSVSRTEADSINELILARLLVHTKWVFGKLADPGCRERASATMERQLPLIEDLVAGIPLIPTDVLSALSIRSADLSGAST